MAVSHVPATDQYPSLAVTRLVPQDHCKMLALKTVERIAGLSRETLAPSSAGDARPTRSGPRGFAPRSSAKLACDAHHLHAVSIMRRFRSGEAVSDASHHADWSGPDDGFALHPSMATPCCASKRWGRHSTRNFRDPGTWGAPQTIEAPCLPVLTGCLPTRTLSCQNDLSQS